jgi:hypothetical protein
VTEQCVSCLWLGPAIEVAGDYAAAKKSEMFKHIEREIFIDRLQE